MEYILYQANYPVANLDIDLTDGKISKINEIYSAERIPLYAKFEQSLLLGMRQWLSSRSIPNSRENYREILAENNVYTAEALALRHYGLNLSDQYWFCPAEKDLKWEKINLFDNFFERQNFHSQYSPDSSLNGEMVKFWAVDGGKRKLYKKGKPPYYQQPYNEVIAGELLGLLGISHVEYDICYEAGAEYSVCETFIDKNTEYVPALYILKAVPRSNNDNAYTHFLKCMEKLSIPVQRSTLDGMIVFDCLINNSDRHNGNFGFVREINSLEFRGFAPLFDQGNSLWYQTTGREIRLGGQPAKPFAGTHERQLSYISVPAIDLSRLTDEAAQAVIMKTLDKNKHMSAVRIKRIAEMVGNQLNYLKGLQEKGWQMKKR